MRALVATLFSPFLFSLPFSLSISELTSVTSLRPVGNCNGEGVDEDEARQYETMDLIGGAGWAPEQEKKTVWGRLEEWSGAVTEGRLKKSGAARRSGSTANRGRRWQPVRLAVDVGCRRRSSSQRPYHFADRELRELSRVNINIPWKRKVDLELVLHGAFLFKKN